ncbi:PD-(D/E)XK nuclease family protein [Hydrogenimonas sp. SS33]|uniref:PD-(D/E)XK nuclease family protein n=1 Tax=Hydrogenimonas leucolamina TaxID=2954236 RepID=UPI00336BE65F
MNAVVFSTFRQVRDFVGARDNALLPKLYTMEEFLSRLVVVPGRIFADGPSRVLYLYRAIETMDLSKLGFEKSFLGFVENADFVFRFFEELSAEKVGIDALRGADMYAEYEEHLSLLEKVWERYRQVLEADGLVDRVTMPDYRLNEGFLRQFGRIDIHIDGYLSRFELEVLRRAAKVPDTQICLHFETTPYNARLKARLGLEELPAHRRVRYDFGRKAVLESASLAPLNPDKVTVAAFEDRMNQAAFVLERVARFVEEGADPAKVAVVLPDESFAEYLRLFDEHRNFNYAMGIPFSQSRYFRRLADLYDALGGRSESARLKMEGDPLVEAFGKVEDFDGFMAFLEALEVTPRELRVIDEVKFGFARYAPLLDHAESLQLLHTWLRQLEDLSMDDTEGGRVTVMGVLESRGQRFDGVVLVDFNEEVVPSVGEKDLFLNSALRERAGMPTRKQKENLQKHYYYRLLRDAERAAVAYVKNEQMQPSRFLIQLGLAESETKDGLYRAILLPDRPLPSHFDGVVEGPNPLRLEPKLTPTKLKDLLLCPRRFYYRYRLGIRPDEEEREEVVGTMIHDALEAAARAKAGFGSAESYFAFVMDRLYAKASTPMRRFDIALGWEERLRDFCERDYERLMHSTQAALEAWCETEYGGFQLSSRVDRVDVTADTVRMIDYKTTSKMRELLKDENDFQLCFYHVWAQRKWPDRRIVTVYEDLYGGETVAVDSEARMADFARVLEEAAAPETVNFAKTDDLKACRYCDYATACGRS